jgi:ferredoxin
VPGLLVNAGSRLPNLIRQTIDVLAVPYLCFGKDSEVRVQLHVDNGKCQGHARCNALAPEVFDLDDLGYVSTPSGEVPESLENKARTGAAACPEQALSVR